MLWLEEIQTKIDLRQYDIYGIKLNQDPKVKNLVKIDVPGLTEKRPNVLRGDSIFATKSKKYNNFEIEYVNVGYVHFVNIGNI